MTEAPEKLYAQEYFTYLHERGWVRKLIRKLYLRDILNYCKGRTIDFGCGTGELLRILPEGSMGLEVNSTAVHFCQSQGLNVKLYDPVKDDYRFDMIIQGNYKSFTMNHVLEHIENSHEVINKLFSACFRLGIERIVFTVPGTKGFQSDKTHVTFLDKKFFADHGLLENEFYKIRVSKYFPVNNSLFGHYFTHNELRLVFDKEHD